MELAIEAFYMAMKPDVCGRAEPRKAHESLTSLLAARSPYRSVRSFRVAPTRPPPLPGGRSPREDAEELVLIHRHDTQK